jgi:hypothetical protein
LAPDRAVPLVGDCGQSCHQGCADMAIVRHRNKSKLSCRDAQVKHLRLPGRASASGFPLLHPALRASRIPLRRPLPRKPNRRLAPE